MSTDPRRTSSIRQAIERGLAHAAQARYAEAATHFARAREQVAPQHDSLTMLLDAYLNSHARYWQAQQALHHASQGFVTAQAEQQARLTELQRIMAELPDNAESVRPAALDESLQHSNQATADDANSLPALDITCFGRFDVRRAGQPIELCQNRNGQSILRYLMAHSRHRETMDVLMEVFWPEDPPAVARHKLHVAVSALRRALNSGYADRKGAGYLLCDQGLYQVNPEARLRIDVDMFTEAYRAGQQAGGDAAIPFYESACRLYSGPLLPEDLYADWSQIRREQLAQAHQAMCGALAGHYQATGAWGEAIQWLTRILAENRCDEVTHRQLMWAYAAAGRRAEAVRQYQRCTRTLAEELGIQPMPETSALFQAILRGEALDAAGLARTHRTKIESDQSWS